MLDKENIYDEKVKPLMEQIETICTEEGISFVTFFMYAEDEESESIASAYNVPPNVRADGIRALVSTSKMLGICA